MTEISPTLAISDQARPPDLIEPIVAFRSWHAIEGRLCSPHVPVFWDERNLSAECGPVRREAFAHGSAQAHRAPQPGCACGIYAYFEPDRALPTIDCRAVTGIVTLWGSIELHAEGMRAEHAQVEALALYSRWSTRQKQAVWTIAEQLGVDLVDLDQIDTAADRYGRRLDPQLLLSEAPAHYRRLTFSGTLVAPRSRPLAA